MGASGAYRWLGCPGSVKLSQTAPHRPSSIYAATGTLAHKFIETQAKRDGYALLDEKRSGEVHVCEGHSIELDAEFIAGVNTMLTYLASVLNLSDWHDIEFRVFLDDYFPVTPPVPVFGTLDFAALTGHTLEVVDYKNGAGVVVSPVENPQLMFYAAGVLRQLSPDLRDRVRRIKLTIVQPHGIGAAPIRSWEIAVLDLEMWIDDVLVPGVEACVQEPVKLVPGYWCRFCPVIHACPALMADALEMAKRDFDAVPADPGELAKALDMAERAELFITRLREFAVDQLEHQVRIPGWGLVPTRATRKWLLPDQEIADQLEDFGASHDDIWETRVRSPAQIERQLLRTRKGRKIWDQTSALIEARSSGVKLGRDDHDARGDFADADDA